jgi:hypothetical protein
MTIAKNALFTDLSAEESTHINGGESYYSYFESNSTSMNGKTDASGYGIKIINGVVVEEYKY